MCEEFGEKIVMNIYFDFYERQNLFSNPPANLF